MASRIFLSVCFGIQLAEGFITNVALGKPVHSSSVKPGYSAGSAVDGNTDTGGYTQMNIIDTGLGHGLAWWKVDLEREVQDATVRIYFRTDYKWRRNGVKLYTSTSPYPKSNYTGQGQLCDTVTGRSDGSDIPDVYIVTCPGRWRYLLLYTDTDNRHSGYSTGPTLDFGEVMVFGCSERTYGPRCTGWCWGCRGACDVMNGSCTVGCRSGFLGAKCDRINREKRYYFDIDNIVPMFVGLFFSAVLLGSGIQMCLD